jgi:hypothetical protein
MAKFFKVCVDKKISKEEGEDINLQFKAGLLKVTDNGGWYLQLFHLPDVDYYIKPMEGEALPTIQLEA